jgi:multiphosphoryl transfer protein
VLANIGSLDDVRSALASGAEGAGVLRTEFLYLNRLTAPSEEEQAALYTEIAASLGERPLVIRTLDIGGDKPLPYLRMAPEANPFLGWRGIRVSLAQPEMLTAQLRAILRASAVAPHRLTILLPMVSDAAEVRAVKAMLAAAQDDLRRSGVPFDETIALGAMIEVPSAVALADQLASEVAYLSIGTNDLCQYALAADRTNPRVAALADPFHPAVLRLIRQVVQATRSAGIHVGLCGEFAGDPLAIPLLVGLGLDELSMSAPAIPDVKAAITGCTMATCQRLAAAALALDSARAVRAYLEQSDH